MKKLLVSVLFFGSFGVAMAQAPYNSFFTSFWNNPVVKIIAPKTTITTAIKAVGNQRYCRNADPVPESYCMRGRPRDMGGDGTSCYALNLTCPGCCVGNTGDMTGSNLCTSAPRCVSAVKPLVATLTPVPNTASCPLAGPSYLDCYMGAAGGVPSSDYMMRCLREMSTIWRAPRRANQTFDVDITGGSPSYFIKGFVGRQITLSLPLASPFTSARGTVVVTDSSKPQQTARVEAVINCPTTSQGGNCADFTNPNECNGGQSRCEWRPAPGGLTHQCVSAAEALCDRFNQTVDQDERAIVCVHSGRCRMQRGNDGRDICVAN